MQLKINFLFSQPKHVVGTEKNRLNESTKSNVKNNGNSDKSNSSTLKFLAILTLIENVEKEGFTVSYLFLVSQEPLLESFHLPHQSRQDLHYNTTYMK